MKRIIEISKNTYELVKNYANWYQSQVALDNVEEAIKNSTPLNECDTEDSPTITIPVEDYLKLLEGDKPSGKWIRQMKSEIADSLEFWDYSPNNNPLARDMLETLTNFWGDIKAESEK